MSTTCCASVTRRGELEPCDKIAVGWMRPVDEEGEFDGGPWPSCAWHLNRWPHQALSLDEVSGMAGGAA